MPLLAIDRVAGNMVEILLQWPVVRPPLSLILDPFLPPKEQSEPAEGPSVYYEKSQTNPWYTQFFYLWIRASRIYRRSTEYVVVRALIILVFAIIFTSAYWRMDYYTEDIFLRLSFCYTTTFYCGLTFLISGITVCSSPKKHMTCPIDPAPDALHLKNVVAPPPPPHTPPPSPCTCSKPHKGRCRGCVAWTEPLQG